LPERGIVRIMSPEEFVTATCEQALARKRNCGTAPAKLEEKKLEEKQ
jgi:hypothetical protein